MPTTKSNTPSNSGFSVGMTLPNGQKVTQAQYDSVMALGSNPNPWDIYKILGINLGDIESSGLNQGFDQLQRAESDSKDAYGILQAHGLGQYKIKYYTPTQIDWIRGLDKYKGTEYYNQYLAMAPAVFQANTSDPDFIANRDQATAQEIAELGSVQREEQHNSFTEQAAQQISAGLNPNLNGISDAGQASESAERDITPVDAFNKRVNALSNIPMQFLSGLLSMGESFQGFQTRGIENAIKGLNLQSGADTYLYSLLANTSPVWTKDEKGSDVLDVDSTVQRLNEALKSVKLDEVPSPRLRKALSIAKQNYGASHDGSFKPTLKIQSLIADMQNGVAQNRFNVGQIFGDPRYSDDMRSMVTKCTEYFMEYQKKVWDIQNRYNDAMAQIADDNSKYNNEQIKALMEKGVPALEAERQVQAAEAEKYQKEYESSMNEMWDNLTNQVSGDHWYNIIGMILVGWLRSQTSQPLNLSSLVPRSAPQANAPSAPKSGKINVGYSSDSTFFE